MNIKPFSCYLIGQTELATQCAQCIIEHGHNILGVIAADSILKNWAIVNHIPYFQSIKDFSSTVKKHSFDYLFSIVNPHILSKSILQFPRYFAINYHNAPLPRYGGTYATTWAILNGEQTHGVTWHIVNEIIDGGDILKQQIFPIDSCDTTQTLDIKCQHYAIETLLTLLSDLSHHSIAPEKQALAERIYHHMYERPQNAGVISWTMSAEEIDRLCRALDFGQNNHFCLPKILINDEIFIPQSVKIFKPLASKIKSTQAQPGTITHISNDFIQIATTTDDIMLYKLTDIEGKNCSIPKLARQFQLTEGDSLPTCHADFRQALIKYLNNSLQHESFWINKIKQAEGMEGLSFLSLNRPSKFYKTVHQINLSPSLYKKLEKIFPTRGLKTILLTTFLLYFYRLNNYHPFSIDFADPSLKSMAEKFNQCFTDHIPLLVDRLSDAPKFSNLFDYITGQLIDLETKGPYSFEVFLHDPQIKYAVSSNTVLIEFIDSMRDYLPKSGYQLVITMTEDGKSFCVFANKTLLIEDSFKLFVKNISLHMMGLLQALSTDINQPIQFLNLLTDQEQQLLSQWNNTDADYPHDKTIHQLFEEQVKKTPHHIAVKFKGDTLTYDAFNKRANQLAHYLREQGVKPNIIVGICLERSLEMIIAIIATLKAGGIYMPIDPTYPESHIQYMLDDSNATIVLTQTSLGTKLQNYLGQRQTKLIAVDQLTNDLLQNPTHNPENLSTPETLIYLLYTSGSSGYPKGTLNKHQGIVNIIDDQIKRFHLCENDNIIGHATLNFDASVFDIFASLLSGATLCVPSKEEILLDQVANTLRTNKISAATLPPAVINTFSPSDVPDLRVLVAAGDVVPLDLIKTWSKALTLFNGYGTTENSMCSSIALCQPEDKKITIGNPSQNIKMYILDEFLQPIPIGIPGELYIGGVGIGCGYLNKEQMTKERFIPDPFSNIPNAKMYKTGDLVRWLPTGNIDFIGRIGAIAKIHGIRLEPEDIAETLKSLSYIDQCVIDVYSDSNNNQYLVAYIIPHPLDAHLDYTVIHNFLSRKLPANIVPSRFVVLNTFPLNFSGKIDKKQLSPKLGTELLPKTEYISPKTQIEKALVKIWKKVLKPKRKIGLIDNFFNLGGHSLLVIQILKLVQQTFNKTISIGDFFAQPTISALAKLIETEEDKNPHRSTHFTYWNDIVLPDDIQVPSYLPNTSNEIEGIFLTGATGFLGIYLLYDLLINSHAKIYCLVRRANVETAYQFLKEHATAYGIDTTLFSPERVIPIVGDLAKPLFGLSIVQFNDLARKIDIIYHCGAYVHHIYDYVALRDINVLGTIEILKLATLNKLKTVYYFSTFAAASNDNGCIAEQLVNNNTGIDDKMNGYVQTKWASERLLTQAHDRNIPINIFRLGWVMGHTRTGVCAAEHNHLLLFIKGCIQLGYAPDRFDEQLTLLPVDFCSDFIVKTSLLQKPVGKVFNLVHKNGTILWNQLIRWIDSHGYPQNIIPVDRWSQYIAKIDHHNALFPLLPLYSNTMGIEQEKLFPRTSPRINNKNTIAFLKSLKMNYPKINEQLLKIYFDFLKKIGFL